MTPNIRIGYGYDVHQLATGKELWLGGLLIPYDKGAVGHSDADVLLHVICDALLGAAALRDIGYHFSDQDPAFKGIDSKILLARVMDMLRKNTWEVGNIDATICLEQPKINPYVPEMIQKIAEVMLVTPGAISIKATTTEKLGFIGKGEGISAHAVALIYST